MEIAVGRKALFPVALTAVAAMTARPSAAQVRDEGSPLPVAPAPPQPASPERAPQEQTRPQTAVPAQTQPGYGQSQPGDSTQRNAYSAQAGSILPLYPVGQIGSGPQSAGRMPSATGGPSTRFGQGFQFAISAENFFGYTHTWGTLTPTMVSGRSIEGYEVSRESDRLALLGNPGALGQSPGVGIDTILGAGLSLGGAMFYSSASAESTTRQESNLTWARTTKDGNVSTLGVEARIGFVTMLTDVVGLWPRLGFRFETASTTTYQYSGTNEATEIEKEDTLSSYSLTPQIHLVISPVSHFAILVGPEASLGLGGSLTQKVAGTATTEAKSTTRTIGIGVGLLGYL